MVNANLRERMKEADHAEAMVAEEVERMMARLKVAEVTPTIVGLQEQLEQIRAGEMDKVRRKYGPFTAAAGRGHGGAHPRHHQQDRARPHFRAAQPRRPSRGRARGGRHPQGVSPPGSIHARHRIARFAARLVAGPLGAGRNWPRAGHECRIEIIKTTGDKITDVPLAKVGSKGLFTKEIEEALLDGRADLAVHSLKDLPTELPDGPGAGGRAGARRPARRGGGQAAGGSAAGRAAWAPARCGAPRNCASCGRIWTIESVRGNLDTRLRKLDEGQYDAILLAAAGLKRLGWADRIAEILPPDVMCPAVGQGALAIETRAAGAGFEACPALDHAATHAAVTAERGVLRRAGRRLPGADRRARHGGVTAGCN